MSSEIRKNAPAKQQPKNDGAQAKTNPKVAPAKAAAQAKVAQAQAEQNSADAQQEEELDAPRRSWFGQKMRWACSAWGSSMLVHMLLLLALALWAIPAVVKPEFKDLVATIEDRPQELLNQVLEQDTTPSTTLAVSSAASALSTATSMMNTPSMEQPQLDTQVSNTPSEVKVNVGEMNVFAAQGTSLNTDVPEGTLGEALSVVEGYADAMDRLTQEILNKLARGKVLVIWAFDQSDSMTDDRAEIMGRIDRVYQELGLSSSATGDALLTAVTSYGQNFLTHTDQPTFDIEKIRAAMSAVPLDETGYEMQCQGIGFAIAKHRQFATSGRRQMMLVLVTDESGDPTTNNQYLESTIAEAKSARCPIYTLGREACFGYPFVRMRWVDPETKIVFHIRLDRGPETPFPECLQTEGLHNRWDAHPSGFGPYEQTRMARETGGIFFMLPSPEVDLVRRDESKYEFEAMRAYLPDLSARPDYSAERDKYEHRRVLWKVITDLNPWDPNLADVVQVRYENFSIDPAQFKQQATAEAAKAMRLIKYFEAAEQALAKVEPLIARDPSFRWRANFELAYAQVIAYQAICYEYGAYITAFIEKPKPITNPFGAKRKTNAWDVSRTRRLLVPEKTESIRARALELYQQVIDDHPGTPWAARAEFEMKRGFGVQLVEDFEDPRRRGVKVPKF